MQLVFDAGTRISYGLLIVIRLQPFPSYPMSFFSRSAFQRYFWAFLICIAGFALQFALEGIIGGRVVFILLYPAVFFSAWLGGLGPGVFSSVFCTVVANFFFISPKYQFELHHPFDGSRLGVFFFTSLLSSWAIAVNLKAMHKLSRAQALAFVYQEQFQIMADSAPVLIWIADPHGHRTWLNRAWIDFTGLSMEENQQEGWLKQLHPEDLNRYFEKYQDALERKTEFKIEYRLKRQDGEYRWLLNHAVPRFDSNKNFVGYIGSCIDINDRIKTEEALREAISARDEFLSIASHELKTPLTPMKLQIQNIARIVRRDHLTQVPAETVLKIAENADQQIKRISALVDNLLDVSRITAGKLSLIVEPFDLAEVLRTVIERFMPQIEFADCRIQTHIEFDLILHADYIRLEQLVSNLLLNAIKYASGSLIEVSAGRSPDETLWFEIKDHGPGIHQDDQIRIFNRYERATGPGISGLGLGLYISQQIVAAHHGSLHLKSEIGLGSTFRVNLSSAIFEQGNA